MSDAPMLPPRAEAYTRAAARQLYATADAASAPDDER